MTIIEIKNQLDKLINSSGYSREEIMSYLNAEPDLSMDELMAYGIALEYLHDKKSKNYKELEKVFLNKRDDLMIKYKM